MTTSYRNVFLLACCQALLLTNARRAHRDERPRRLFARRRQGARHARRDDVRAGLRGCDDADVAVDGEGRPAPRLHGRRADQHRRLRARGPRAVDAELRRSIASRPPSSASTTRSDCSTGSRPRKSHPRPTGRAPSRWCWPAASSADSLGPAITRWGKDMFASPFLGSFLLLAVVALAALAVQSHVEVPKPSPEESAGGGRPLREIVRQPVFIVAALAATLGYGLMNLLMTATPLAMDFCSLAVRAGRDGDLVARGGHVRAGLRDGLAHRPLRSAQRDPRRRRSHGARRHRRACRQSHTGISWPRSC